MTALVLSGSFHETSKFSRQKKLGYGIRHVVSQHTIEGVRPTSVHILPSGKSRRDRHAINVQMKHIKRRCPKIPWIEYDYDQHTGIWHPKDESAPALVPEAVARAQDPADRLSVMEQMAADIDEPVIEKDTGKDAVPGQTALEEHLEDDIPEWMRDA